MHDFSSLLAFTLIGQCAAGLAVFLLFDARGSKSCPVLTQTWVALGLLVLAVVFSVLHLSQPLNSPYTITNLGTSWLSREILAAGLFGAGLLAAALFKRPWLNWLAALLGLVFVWVMCSVYMIATQPVWNTWLTPAAFFAAALLLGGSLKLCLDLLHDRGSAEAQRRDSMGILPGIIGLVGAFRLVTLVLDAARLGHASAQVIIQIILLLAGLALLFFCVFLRAHRQLPCELDVKGNWKPVLMALLVFLLFAVSELCGRVIFFQGYTWFGM